jgi:hypothetical protein
MVFPGRLGVLTPSERHVPQTIARWRASGFDAHVAPLSPYEENDPTAVHAVADPYVNALCQCGSGHADGERRLVREQVLHRRDEEKCENARRCEERCAESETQLARLCGIRFQRVLLGNASGTTLGSAMHPSQRSPLSTYLGQRNSLLLTKRCYPLLYPIAVLFHFGFLFDDLVRGNKRTFAAALRGWWAGVRGETGRPAWPKAVR